MVAAATAIRSPSSGSVARITSSQRTIAFWPTLVEPAVGPVPGGVVAPGRGVVVEPGGAGCTPIWMMDEALGIRETVNVGVGVLGSNTHAPNENVSISEILRFAEVMARTILILGGADPNRLE